jgi:hypothetical protein
MPRRAFPPPRTTQGPVRTVCPSYAVEWRHPGVALFWAIKAQRSARLTVRRPRAGAVIGGPSGPIALTGLPFSNSEGMASHVQRRACFAICPPAEFTIREGPSRMFQRARADANLDHELRTQIQIRLSTSNFARLRHLKVEIDGRQVVLCGQVGSFYERQIAVALAERASKNLRVIDRLVVKAGNPTNIRSSRPAARPRSAIGRAAG